MVSRDQCSTRGRCMFLVLKVLVCQDYLFALLHLRCSQENEWAKENDQVHPMVMSIGFNPFYGNKVKTAVRFCRPFPMCCRQ